MSHIRYFVSRSDQGWSIRRDVHRVYGLWGAEVEAVSAAVGLAAIDRIRGHKVEVVKQGLDGRWTPCRR